MANLEELILSGVARKSYKPLKPKALARKLGVTTPEYADFRRTLRSLEQQGRIEIGKNHTIRAASPHGTVTGTYRRTGSGAGYVRPHYIEGQPGTEIRIAEQDSLDAATGDIVLVRLTTKPNRPGVRRLVRFCASWSALRGNFVGVYFERDGEGHVRVDGAVFAHSIYVGDPGAKARRSR